MGAKNSNVVKWVAIFIILALAATGWVYQLGVQGEQLKANNADDAKIHAEVPKIDIRVTRAEEQIKAINDRFIEFQRQSLDNQKQILQALAR